MTDRFGMAEYNKTVTTDTHDDNEMTTEDVKIALDKIIQGTEHDTLQIQHNMIAIMKLIYLVAEVYDKIINPNPLNSPFHNPLHPI